MRFKNRKAANAFYKGVNRRCKERIKSLTLPKNASEYAIVQEAIIGEMEREARGKPYASYIFDPIKMQYIEKNDHGQISTCG